MPTHFIKEFQNHVVMIILFLECAIFIRGKCVRYRGSVMDLAKKTWSESQVVEDQTFHWALASWNCQPINQTDNVNIRMAKNSLFVCSDCNTYRICWTVVVSVHVTITCNEHAGRTPILCSTCLSTLQGRWNLSYNKYTKSECSHNKGSGDIGNPSWFFLKSMVRLTILFEMFCKLTELAFCVNTCIV